VHLVWICSVQMHTVPMAGYAAVENDAYDDVTSYFDHYVTL